MRLTSYLLVFLLIPLYGFSIDCSLPDCTKRELKKGITWYHKRYSNLLGGPQNVNIVDIDITDPHIYVKPVYKQSSSCERTSSMGNRTSAVAGINGGFFDPNNGCVPVGLLKIDNKVISYAVSYRPPRSALGITADEHILFRRTDSTDSFPEAVCALGGMPNLVKDGRLYVTTSEEQAESIDGVHPRTAICKTSGNRFLMITVDGRAADRKGMSLNDLAQYLIWLGCSDGINLDGGGSTTMWINTEGVVNYPSDGSERYLSNGLFVYFVENLPPVIEHTPIGSSVRADIVIKAKVTDDHGLKAVNLKFRNKDVPDFTSRAMIGRGNDIYEGVIKVDEITSDTIQYYIAAWDGTLRSLLPSDAESNNHYFTIHITQSEDAGTDISDDNLDIIVADSEADDIISTDDFIVTDLGNDMVVEEVSYDNTSSADPPDFDIGYNDVLYDSSFDSIADDVGPSDDRDVSGDRLNYDTAVDLSLPDGSGCSCNLVE